MTRSAHIKTFTLRLAGSIVAICAIYWLLVAFVPWVFTAAIWRGAVIGGTIGLIVWPVSRFAQDHFEATGAVLGKPARWGYAWRFALIIFGGLIVLATVGFVAGFFDKLPIAGLTPADQGAVIGAILAPVALMIVPANYMMIGAGFAGAKRRAGRT